MDFPTLFSVEEVDEVIDQARNKITTQTPRVLSDAEQLVQSIAVIHNRFQHIGQKIELLWGTEELQNYLSNLVTETQRSNGDKRQGFPPEIMAHILKVHNIHFRSIGKAIPILDWETTRGEK